MTPLLLGLAASVVAGGCAWAAGLAAERAGISGAQAAALWRGARFAALLPLALVLATPVIEALPVPDLLAARPSAARPADTPQPHRAPDRVAYPDAATAPGAAFRPHAPAGIAQDDRSATGSLALPDMTGFLAPLLFCLYAAGAGISAVRFAARRRRLASLMRARRTPSDRLSASFGSWAAHLGLWGKVRLAVIEAEVSPFVTGWDPVVVIPARLDRPDRAGAAEMALLHELLHVARGDERGRLAGEILGILLWFNPFWARIERRLTLSREFACDAQAIETLGAKRRREYASALIEAARGGPLPAPRVSAFTLDNKRMCEMRIKAILNHIPGAGRTAGLALVTASAVALSAAPAVAAQAFALHAGAASAVAFAAESETDASTPIRAVIQASPMTQLERLESLSALESLNESAMLSPANLAAVMSYGMGRSDELVLRAEDQRGEPVTITVNRDNEDSPVIEFTDEDGAPTRLTIEQGSGDLTAIRFRRLQDAEDFLRIDADGERDHVTMQWDDDRGERVWFEVQEADDNAADVSVRAEGQDQPTRLRFRETDERRVYAPAAGRVTHVGEDSPGRGSVGRYAVIAHEGGWSTVFYNLASMSIGVGDAVDGGALIGETAERIEHHEDDDHGRFDVSVNGQNVAIVRTNRVEL